MPFYKQVVLANLKSTPKEVSEIFKDLATKLYNRGGILRSVDNRGVKLLGYPIEDRRWGELQRHREGKLILASYTASPKMLNEISLDFKNNPSVLRSQIFKSDDPIDGLYNTRVNLDKLEDDLGGKRITEEEELDVMEIIANSTEETDGDEDDPWYDANPPEWRRDATFEPIPPKKKSASDKDISGARS